MRLSSPGVSRAGRMLKERPPLFRGVFPAVTAERVLGGRASPLAQGVRARGNASLLAP